MDSRPLSFTCYDIALRSCKAVKDNRVTTDVREAYPCRYLGTDGFMYHSSHYSAKLDIDARRQTQKTFQLNGCQISVFDTSSSSHFRKYQST